jgi:hypothetical protein
MNHPLVSCHNYFQEVANLFEDLQRYNTLKPMDVDLPFMSFDVTNPGSGPFIEKYEGATEEYGVGVTFMSEFNRDQYAAEHVENVYYPFA